MEKQYNEWYWKLYRWFKWDAKHVHRDIAQGFKNLWRWFPLVWKDRDWDDHYIWEALKFKIANTAKYIGGHDRHVTANRDAEIMRTCVRLIDKVQHEWYCMEHTDYHEFKYNWIPSDQGKDLVQLDVEVVREDYKPYFAKYPRQYKEISKKCQEDYTIAVKIAYKNHKRAKALIFKLLEENIERWWD